MRFNIFYIGGWDGGHWPLFSKKMVSEGLIFLQNQQRQAGSQYLFGNITGGCSDMVWIWILLWAIGPIIGACIKVYFLQFFVIMEQMPI